MTGVASSGIVHTATSLVAVSVLLVVYAAGLTLQLRRLRRGDGALTPPAPARAGS